MKIVGLVGQSINTCTVGLRFLYSFIITITEAVIGCIGENIFYNCNLESVTHEWIVPSLNTSVILSEEDGPELSLEPYTFEITMDSGNIITTLSTIATVELNGTTISCINENSLLLQCEVQTIVYNTVIFGECVCYCGTITLTIIML